MAESPRMQVDSSWPKPLPHGWALGEVSGVAVDAARQRLDHPAPRQRACAPGHRIRPGRQCAARLGGPGKGYDWFQSEHGITIDAKGFVWLGGNGPSDAQVLKFTQQGAFVLQIGHPATGAASNDTTRLGRPAGVAVDDAAHEVYVADGYGNRRIIVFDSETGAYKRHWGAYGDGRPSDAAQHYDPRAPLPRQFGRPVHCVRLAKDGLVYVCDRQNDRIQVFHKDGRFVTEYRIAPETTGLGSAWDLGLWPDPGQTLLFNGDGRNEVVRILRRADGVVLGAFGRPGRGPGEFHWVHSLAIDSRGNVFTTEVDGGNRVQRFVPEAGR